MEGGMLFLLRFFVKQPPTMTLKELYTIWAKEADAALAAKRLGKVKELYKVSGKREVIAIVEAESHHDLDRLLAGLPLMMEMGHSVELEVLPIHPYEDFAEDLREALEEMEA